MASSSYSTVFLALILVLNPWTATTNFLTPLLSPISDDVCKEVECGKGTCKPSNNSAFAYSCECEPGWKQARLDPYNDLNFLPCVVPSDDDVCKEAECGNGTCKPLNNNTFAYSCECEPGWEQARPYHDDGLSSLPCVIPSNEDVCKEVRCGKGTCKPSSNSTVAYSCECEPGWKQDRPDHDDYLNFLPCVIPNCTLNYSCREGQPPVQQKGELANQSIYDPCYWVDCGGGECNKTSPLTYTCECKEGYYNLFNVTDFPCFSDCELGVDCSALGIVDRNKSRSSASLNLADNGTNQASSMAIGIFNWLITAIISLAPVLWK